MRSTVVLLAATLACSRPAAPAQRPGPETTGGSTGSGTGGSGTGGAGGAMLMPDAGPVLPPEADLPGPMPFGRLTSLEYRNTLRDLLGVAAPNELRARDFDNWQDGWATGVGRWPSDVERIMNVAITAAAEAVKNLAPLVPCNPIPAAEAEQEACARQFITRFGLRAYRRPLETAEQEALLVLYRSLRGPESAADFPAAIRMLIEAMLQSPFFVYRWEVGPTLEKDGTLVRLGPYEVASRLSYGLWATMPDEALFAAAAARELQTPEQLERQARRLLADPRAADLVADFHAHLLRAWDLPDLQKDTAFHYTPALGQAMLDELRAFTGGLMVGPGARGTLVDLLTATSTFADAGLAKIYGLPPPAGTGLVPVTLDPQQRAGVLTQAAFLTGNAGADDPSVVQRGVRLLEDILCQPLPPPPPNVDVPVFPEPRPNATTRERYEQHHASPCADCHLRIDPLGFALLNYDAVGAYHVTEPVSPLPIDASGSLQLPSGQLSWTTGVDLMKKMATLPEVRDCLGKQWFRYLLHRTEGPGDARSLQLAGDAFRASQDTLKELLVALVRTRAFTHRTPSAGEVLP